MPQTDTGLNDRPIGSMNSEHGPDLSGTFPSSTVALQVRFAPSRRRLVSVTARCGKLMATVESAATAELACDSLCSAYGKVLTVPRDPAVAGRADREKTSPRRPLGSRIAALLGPPTNGSVGQEIRVSDRPVFIYAATYADRAGAEADYDALLELHAAKLVGTYDVALVTKEVDVDALSSRRNSRRPRRSTRRAGRRSPRRLVAKGR